MVIHLIHHPVSAKKFVEPLIKSLIGSGIETELWIENREHLAEFTSIIGCPKKFAKFDLTANPFALLVRLIQVSREFCKLRPAAIHAHQTRAAFLPLLAALIVRVPVRIYHNHGAPYLGYRGGLRALFWLLEFLNCLLATHVITVSKSIRRKMTRHHIVKESKCEVLGEGSVCGIDLAEFSMEQFDSKHAVKSRQGLKIPLDAFVVLYVGRPFKRKGFHTLVDAWQHVRSVGDDCILLIAGCTAEDVSRAGKSVTEGILTLGYVMDLRPCYAACDIVVLPSLHEGLPYSLLESAAAGKALVGSNIPGIDSIIMNGQNGLLVPVSNPSQLADAISTLRDNIKLKKQMGKVSRRYVEQNFSRSLCQKLLLDYYRKIGITNYTT